MFSDLRVAIRSVVARFAVSRNGNVAVIFAIACIPVVAAMGVAVDYTRGAQTASQMQDALDSASLALSRRADLSTLSSAQVQKFAKDYFDANFHNNELQNLALTASYTPGQISVTLNASGDLPTDFMGVLGKSVMPIGRSSTTVWGEARLRVALALDNTGSMQDDGKMTALKTATHNLLTQLQGAASTDGDVYVSIVPFSRDVNAKSIASTPYDSTDWIRWDLWDSSSYGASHGTCTGSSSSGGYSGHRGHGGYGGSASSYDNDKSGCESHGYTWTPDHTVWNGCITDRDQNYDTQNTAPSTSDTATLFPADQYSNCPGQMMSLSYDWTALGDEVDAMYPNGSTNQTIGLQWAWQSLTEAPFTIPAEDPSRVYKHAIILLSDGMNTQNRWGGNGSSHYQGADNREELLCSNIKATGVTIYTVQVNTGSDPLSTVLQDCASSSDKFFLLTSANQIVTTFQQIGTELSDLRISQ